MVGKDGGVGETLRTVFIFLWVVLSVVVYGSLCSLTSLFGPRIPRMVSLLWNRHLLLVAGIRVEVRGLEKLSCSRRYIFVANHQSHIDIPVLTASLRHHLSFIAKKELFRIPFFGWGMYALGHIWIDRGNARKAHSSIRRAVERLKKNNVSLVLFPEGTRSETGEVGVFKQGSFSLVQQAGVEVVPVTIMNTCRLLPKHSKEIRSGTAILNVGDPITIDPSMTKAEISERVRSSIIEGIDS